MKEYYEELELEVIVFNTEDVITESGGNAACGAGANETEEDEL